MNGCEFPEIPNMANANMGGYLSDAALNELITFKTKVERPKYMVMGVALGQVTLDGDAHSYNKAFTTPTGYAVVGTVGVHVGTVTGTAPIRCCLRGEIATDASVTVYYGGGLYASGTGSPVAYILLRRSS